MMIKHLISSNNIKLSDDEETHNYMLELICSLITGDGEAWKQLLDPSEMFLTEIVSNKFCNIDVDKCDYLLRDRHYVGLEIEPFIDFLNRAKIVIHEDGCTHIGYHANDFFLIENMFINRAMYHDKVYQLPEVAGIERHVKDICLLAQKAGFEMDGLLLTEIQQNCEAFNHLDDSVLDLIRSDTAIDNEAMQKSKELISYLDRDKFYIRVCETKDKDDVESIYRRLVDQFGSVFCKVKKLIPYAQIPKNIPLYQGDRLVAKQSEHDLAYESTIIYCTAFDKITIKNITNYLCSSNNNNNNID
jgi:HD superfamily phosphohydrolase